MAKPGDNRGRRAGRRSKSSDPRPERTQTDDPPHRWKSIADRLFDRSPWRINYVAQPLNFRWVGVDHLLAGAECGVVPHQGRGDVGGKLPSAFDRLPYHLLCRGSKPSFRSYAEGGAHLGRRDLWLRY